MRVTISNQSQPWRTSRSTSHHHGRYPGARTTGMELTCWEPGLGSGLLPGLQDTHVHGTSAARWEPRAHGLPCGTPTQKLCWWLWVVWVVQLHIGILLVSFSHNSSIWSVSSYPVHPILGNLGILPICSSFSLLSCGSQKNSLLLSLVHESKQVSTVPNIFCCFFPLYVYRCIHTHRGRTLYNEYPNMHTNRCTWFVNMCRWYVDTNWHIAIHTATYTPVWTYYRHETLYELYSMLLITYTN